MPFTVIGISHQDKKTVVQQLHNNFFLLNLPVCNKMMSWERCGRGGRGAVAH